MNDEDLRKPFALLRHEDRAATSPFALLAPPPPAYPRLRPLIAAAASMIAVVGALGIGTVWGTTTGYASGRLEAERQHAATAHQATNAVAALRSQLGQARRPLGVTGTDTISPAAVDANLSTIEASLLRIETDLKQRAAPASPVSATNDVAMHQAMAVTCATLGKVVVNQAKPARPFARSVAFRSH